MQTLAADVQGLRKGLDLTKSERDKQPDNFIIFVSFFIVFVLVNCSCAGCIGLCNTNTIAPVNLSWRGQYVWLLRGYYSDDDMSCCSG